MTASVQALDAGTAASLVPRRDARSHKGTHGRVVAVCGSLDHAGAALLVGLAAARAGAGLVCLAVPTSLQPVLAGRVPELVTIGLPELASGRLDLAGSMEQIGLRDTQAVVVGPGLAPGESTRALVRALIGQPGAPMVIDAQGLNELAQEPGWSVEAVRPLVLTPHPIEFGRLTGERLADDDDERSDGAATAAREWHAVVVLKGAATVIAAPDGRICRASFQNAALATAGTGDVLAGTIGALLAQGLEPYDAARLGVYLHGAAATAIADRMGVAGLIASDLPLAIALARHELVAKPGQGP